MKINKILSKKERNKMLIKTNDEKELQCVWLVIDGVDFSSFFFSASHACVEN